MDAHGFTFFTLVILALFNSLVYGQACNSTLSSTTGVIQSPGYPDSYPDSLNCFWKIEAPPGMVVEFNIETFDLEASVSCVHDFLTVYDGLESVSTVMLLQPSCGSSIPWPAHPTTLLSSGNIMTIVFTTDSSINSTGFRAIYHEVEPRENIIFVADALGSKIYKQNRFGDNSEEIPYLVLATPTAIDYDPVDKKLFITDVGTSRIFRTNLDGTGQETIASVLVSVPDGLAVDPVSRVVYWTDVGTDSFPTLSVARLDGSFRRILVDSEIESPRDIVVQLNEGYVYWTDWGSVAKIERMNGDGTDRTVLVNSGLGWPNGIAIDTVGKKLYWAEAFFNKIEKSNLDGSMRELVKQFNVDVHPFGLIYDDGAIIWTDWSTEGIDVADSEFRTEPSTLLVGGMATRIHGLALYSTADPAIVVNDCSFRGQEGGCEELCPTVPSGISCLAVSPTFQNCPNDMFITTKLVTPVSWTEPTVHSPSGVPVTVTTSHPSNSVNLSPNDDTIQVIYSAVDEFGNSAKECVFNISATYPDEDPPVISGCPSNISRELLSRNDVINVTWEEPKVVDDSGTVTLTVHSHDLNGGVFPVGSTTVIYCWEDISGNSAECSFVVTVSFLDKHKDGIPTSLLLGILGGAVMLCLLLSFIGVVMCKGKRGLCKNPRVPDDHPIPPPYPPGHSSQGGQRPQFQISFVSHPSSRPQIPPPPPRYSETAFANSQYIEINDTDHYCHTMPSADEQFKCPPSLPHTRNDL